MLFYQILQDIRAGNGVAVLDPHGDLAERILTETLREMERTGIVEREVYPIVPPKVEYRLTSVGAELLMLSHAFTAWFDSHHENIHKAKKVYDRQKQ